MSPHVVVIGGGLAGITAALDCAQAGASTTLLEVRPRLGGAAYSFQRDGLRVDNGQHVFLRCCLAYRRLLASLGSDGHLALQRRLEIPILSRDGTPATLRRQRLPAPLHLTWTLARYPHLTLGQRLSAARAALALRSVAPASEANDALSFGDWLAEHGQDDRAIAVLWDLIALPTLNLPAAEASLALAAFVFQTGLLSGANAADIGFHTRPLSETIGDPALALLEREGVRVHLGWRAEQVRQHHERLEVLARGQLIDADSVILAIPHTRLPSVAGELLGQAARTPSQLGVSPIVNLHLVFDRPVSDLTFAAGVDTPVQYLFDRSRANGLQDGCYLAISLSAASADARISSDRLRERYLREINELLPASRDARLERFLVTREHQATFRAAPGSRPLRPGPQTAVPGLLLAGAFTQTGWPATLESAVRSGHAAARHALLGCR